jgi:hypothetical protein
VAAQAPHKSGLPGAPAIEATQNRDKLKIADGYRAGAVKFGFRFGSGFFNAIYIRQL